LQPAKGFLINLTG